MEITKILVGETTEKRPVYQIYNYGKAQDCYEVEGRFTYDDGSPVIHIRQHKDIKDWVTFNDKHSKIYE